VSAGKGGCNDSQNPRTHPHSSLRPFSGDTGTAFAGKIVGFLDLRPEGAMAQQKQDAAGANITRERLIELLNEDLAREYQAIIAYVVYSQVLKGAEYMSIAQELEKHAAQELKHALIISKQIDYLGGMPTVTAKPVKTSEDARVMLRADLDNE
jgi:bacterioferritin